MKLWQWLVLTTSLLIATIVIDCSAGQKRYLECVVVAHRYVPAWVESRLDTDIDGHISTTIIHHDEEFHVICKEHGAEMLDVMTSKAHYYMKTNGQEVTVKINIGRWTGFRYLPRFE